MSLAPLTLRDVAPEDWLHLSLAFRDLSFEQTRAYAEPAAARIGGHARFVAVERAGQTLALAALRCRNLPGLKRGILWLPAGPMILRHGENDPDVEEITAILAALRHQLVTVEGNILRLRFSALSFLDQSQGAEAAADSGFHPTARAAGYKTFLLDTRPDEDEAMRRLHGKWRNQLRGALKSDLKVEMAADASLTDRFEAVYTAVKGSKGFSSAISPEFHRQCSGKDYRLETIVISRDGRDLSAALLVVTGQNANYLFGATNAEGRDHRSGFQLTWTVIGRCRELGLRWLDLGGIDDDATPDLTTYKERTGATFSEGAGPYQATPGDLFTRAVQVLEGLRSWLKGKRR